MGNPFTAPLRYSTTPLLLYPTHTPTGIRTPVAALRTQNPRPLDDGGAKHAIPTERETGFEPATFTLAT
jgi:hypothetical protein